MKSITLSAPAKVNLFLKVLNKRSDGYHNIFTLFERISLADKITLTAIPNGIEVSSDKFITANAKDNLVYKAAELILEKGKEGERRGSSRLGLRPRSNIKGMKIRVEKRIPIAAGLGGGSSDAASALIGIDKLFDLKLSRQELMGIGRKLGADVPFFLLNTPFAIGRGRGDELKKVNSTARLWHLIIYPGFKLATKDVYGALGPAMRRGRGLTFNKTDVRMSRYLNGAFDAESVEHMLTNDLENTAIAKKNVLGSIIERLADSLGRKAIVSGSGPGVFCLYATRKEAMAARKKLLKETPAGDRKGWQVFLAETL